MTYVGLGDGFSQHRRAHLWGENCIEVLRVHDAHVDTCCCINALLSPIDTMQSLLSGQVKPLRACTTLVIQATSCTVALGVLALQGGRCLKHVPVPVLFTRQMSAALPCQHGEQTAR